FLGFLVVITSVMEQSFRDYFMTPFHTEILTGSVDALQGAGAWQECDRKYVWPVGSSARILAPQLEQPT
ncbi:hypothetical protein ABIB42_004572, partial [Massilia sp. UYP32]|uniref:hypothetical protein n=1 Tax=Massilia sp. UYP32 TaxID=1756386 RepID=UPI003D1F81B3